MKKQRIICILIAFCLFFVTLAYGEKEKTRISFTLSNENGNLRLTTSLFPDQPFTIDIPEEIEIQDLLMMIRPEVFPELIHSFAETVITWNKERSTEIQEGFFSGDLFDQATVKQVTELNKEDMQLLVADHLISRIHEKGTDTETVTRLERILRMVIGKISGNDTKARIITYDQGRYLTVNIGDQQATTLIISADLSEKETSRIVIGRSAGNAAYYDEINCKQTGAETDYVFTLFRTTAPAFRMVSEQDCVQFAEIRITDQGDQTYEFEGEINSVLLPETARITGNSPAGEEKVNIEMDIEANEEDISAIILPIILKLMIP